MVPYLHDLLSTVEDKTLLVRLDIQYIFDYTMEVILQKKDIEVWMISSVNDNHLHLWVDYPFNCYKSILTTQKPW